MEETHCTPSVSALRQRTMLASQPAGFQVDQLFVHVLQDDEELAAHAATRAATLLRAAIRARGRARIVFSAANSQLRMVHHLTANTCLDWHAIEIFHVDEYEGISSDAPTSFRRWVRQHVVDRVHPRVVHYLAGDALDIEAECHRYAELLAAAPIDVALLGFGENGHIGFNDPHEADFHDPLPVRRVTLDDRCRLQQCKEGHFADLALVPRIGLTLTCPTLLSARSLVCSVPGRHKAEAVRNALEWPVSESCPGSILRTHQDAHLYIDTDSAGLLTGRNLGSQT